ncbi:3-hydroxyacyl-CoA dehydrogenase [Bacillus testis]|uniref:3-hydroxyacyl-CoA dehydrogenase n=1 Tax=Bacillus testis TaxID=1622072 RepID=UPI00067E67BD|nr:3-hydroxyacyl-CoA dehydrogenase [Bacillus testis]
MVKTIVVIGAGVMGRGIAYASALGGYEVFLTDVDRKSLDKARQEIDSIIEQSVERIKITPSQGKEIEQKLVYSMDLRQCLATADLVIEAVPEKKNIKQRVFQEMERYAPGHCLFATNTSTMSPTEIGSYGKRPHKTIAMHFFNPVHKINFIEIIKGLETDDATVEEVIGVAKRMGKETAVVNEFPGFITSRISALVGNEAFYMLQEGLGTPQEIDKAIKLGLKYPMGPFELVDLVGLDARLNNLLYLYEKLGEKYRPAPLLEQYVKAGRLGRKTGKGVYDYSQENERGVHL